MVRLEKFRDILFTQDLKEFLISRRSLQWCGEIYTESEVHLVSVNRSVRADEIHRRVALQRWSMPRSV